MSLQLLVILVPVIFGLMGFAIDLGRLWMIRGELHQAASAVALAAASQMGPVMGLTAETAANQTFNEATGNKYNFGSTTVPAATITCFSSIDSAAANETAGTTDCGATDVVAVQASISVPAPLLFWSLLPGGENRTTTVASYAVAGMSAPVCTGCGIMPIAVQAFAIDDEVNWGFIPGDLYTLYFSCAGTTPGSIAGVPVPYIILNRVDSEVDEATQMVRQGAIGLTGSTITTPNACTASASTPFSCVNVGDIEQIPQSGSATPGRCEAPSSPVGVTNLLCGLYSRMSTDTFGSCGDYSALLASYPADTDASYVTEAAGYVGNGRRILTVAVVNTLATDTSCGGMTVLGFRQFLLNPAADGSYNPVDSRGRFAALYLGTVAPISQGWFDRRYTQVCPVNGPGKVVLHQ
jgi:Flp pilus assembly protein TadG